MHDPYDEPPTADWPLRRYLDWWLAVDVAALRPRTRVRYARSVRYYSAELGDVPLGQLTRSQLQGALDRAIALRGLSPLSATSDFRAIASALRLAMADRIIDHNPVDRVRVPAIQAAPVALPTSEQATALLRAALEPGGVGGREWFGPLIACALLTGARSSELTGLRWANVHLPDAPPPPEPSGRPLLTPLALGERGAVGTIDIVEQVTMRSDADFEWHPPKTASGHRTLPVTPGLAAILHAQRDRLERARMRRGTWRWRDLDLVFPTERGTPASPTTLARARQRIALRAGIAPAPTFHTMRHLWVSMLVEADVPLPTIVRLAGHRDGLLIQRVYYGVLEDGMDRAADAIAQRTAATIVPASGLTFRR